MEHFVTLFNNSFLPQGLALQLSMERHVREYTLWILCVDDETFSILDSIKLRNVKLLQLSKFETNELLDVKKNRTIGEYCWTLTPFAPRFVFESDDNIHRVTYIDADIWFRKDATQIFKEFDASQKQVLITDHAYSADYDQSESSGQYCVQFLTFTRDGGETVRKWWEDRCLEWCYAKVENGRFGDQKYLDVWPEIFSNDVHVLKNKELTLGPWNASRFPYGHSIFFHFHGVRLVSVNEIFIGDYFLPSTLIKHVYKPYFSDLNEAIKRLQSFGFVFKPQAVRSSIFSITYKKLARIYRWLCLNFRGDTLPLNERHLL